MTNNHFRVGAMYGSGGGDAPVLHAYFATAGGQGYDAAFRGSRGTIRIRYAAPDLVTGSFELLATAPIRGSARPDTMGVRIAGSFVATTVSP